jgi:hypothetical protein
LRFVSKWKIGNKNNTIPPRVEAIARGRRRHHQRVDIEKTLYTVFLVVIYPKDRT